MHCVQLGSDGQQTMKCKYCSELRASIDDLEKHTAEMHNHPCHLCDRKYHRKQGLQIHMEAAHQRYKCDKCGKNCVRKFKSIFKIHFKIHIYQIYSLY